MTFHPRHWCQLGGEQAKLIHIDDQGLAYVVQSRPIVADLDAKLTAGGDASELLAAWGRIPWSNLQWFEWSSSLAVRFRYEVPGHGSHEASFLVRSSAEREIIASAITEASGLSPSERARSASELAKGPLAAAGIALGLGAVLFTQLGATAEGSGRTAARAALVTSLANLLGLGGIAALTSLGVGAATLVLLRRLRTPPRVWRLSQGSVA